MLHRRLVRGHEGRPTGSESMLYWSMIALMARRLTETATPSWRPGRWCPANCCAVRPTSPMSSSLVFSTRRTGVDQGDFSDTPGSSAQPPVRCKYHDSTASYHAADLQLYHWVLIAPKRVRNSSSRW